MQAENNELNNIDFMILCTNYAKKWSSPEYLHGFPVLTAEATHWLVTKKIKAVGIDALSIEPVESADLPIHHILLENDVLIIENMKIPEKLVGQTGELVIAPLNFAAADGAPVRVFSRI